MAVLLGGRGAEEVVFGHLSTGASDDLSKATEIARQMVTRYGMVPELGAVAYDLDPPTFLGGQRLEARSFSEETAREIDIAVRALVDRAGVRARQVLTRNKDLLREVAATLLVKETLTEEELAPVFARVVGEANGHVPDDERVRVESAPVSG